MAKNKLSVWALIILIATIISAILLIVSVALTIAGFSVVAATARQAAIDSGATGSEIDIAVAVATGAVIVALVFSSIFEVLKIIGGFMFSLKGRWGIFCIVVSILSVVGGVWSLISDITNKAAIGTIVTAAISLVLSVVFCIACFMHRKEING